MTYQGVSILVGAGSQYMGRVDEHLNTRREEASFSTYLHHTVEGISILAVLMLERLRKTDKEEELKPAKSRGSLKATFQRRSDWTLCTASSLLTLSWNCSSVTPLRKGRW